MPNEKLPICLPKFDKITFFLNNLQYSKHQNETDVFRQRSNSCSLNHRKGFQLHHTDEKIEFHRITDPIKGGVLLKRDKESATKGCPPIDGHHLRSKYRQRKENNAKTYKSGCSEKPENKGIKSASKNSEPNQIYSNNSGKNQAVKTTPAATENDCVSNMFYPIVPVCRVRNRCKKRSGTVPGQKELLSTVLQINPDARQNISLIRHGSLPPLKW